jgi:hypothetical protein
MDEGERDEWLEYFAATCPNCGGLRSECSDPTRDLYPQRSVCWPSAVRESVVAAVAEEARERQARRADGAHAAGWHVSVWVSEFDLNPDDNFV